MNRQNCPRGGMGRWRRSLIATMAGALLVVAVYLPAHAEQQTEKEDPCTVRSAEAVSSCIIMSTQQVLASAHMTYRDAGRLLVYLTDREAGDAELQSEALKAIRSMAESFHALNSQGRMLEGAVRDLSVARASNAASTHHNLAQFTLAARESESAAETVRSRIQDLVGQSLDNHDVDVRLRNFVASARVYAAAQIVLSEATSALNDALFPYATRAAPEGAIRLSLYEFIDDRTRLDVAYGLYTYVLFRTPNVRNERLIHALISSTGWAEHARSVADPSAINVFVVPVRNRIQTLVAERTSSSFSTDLQNSDLYDYTYAGNLLLNVCVGNPGMCAEGGGGPYLLSHPDRLTSGGGIAGPYLLVDLSLVDERAFGEFVRAVKEQVMLPEFTSREKIDTLRFQLLDLALKAGDWLVPVKNAVADIVSRAGPAGEN